jgi:hypothetical protein
MPNIKITRTTLRTLKPSTKPVIYWDAAQPGFGVRVQPTGAASYVVMYRLRGVRSGTRPLFIGTHVIPASFFA